MVRWRPAVLKLLAAMSPFWCHGSLASEFVADDFFAGRELDTAVRTLALQTDGKVLVGGLFASIDGKSLRALARLNTDGSVDAGFTPQITGSNVSVESIKVQSDGKILVGGFFSAIDGVARSNIARLNIDGSLDASFGNVQSGTDEKVTSIALQPDKKILIGGWFTTVNGKNRGRVARLEADGALDQQFGAGLYGANRVVADLALQADGTILIAGYFTTVNGNSKTRIARLRSDGSLHDSIDLKGADGNVLGIAVQADEKILLVGDFGEVFGIPRSRLARLDKTGALDPSFTPTVDGEVSVVVAQADGKIIIGGKFTGVNGEAIERIARLDASGDLDTSFAEGSGLNAYVSAIVPQSDGKILVGGDFTDASGSPRDRIARLEIADRTSPRIVLIGDNPMKASFGFEFIDPGARVVDETDEERTVFGDGLVDTEVPGTYTVTYSAEDAAGNAAEPVQRIVVVPEVDDDEDSDGVNNYREAADGTDPNDPASFNPLSKGLVAYYAFNGNAEDESGYGNNLTLSSYIDLTDDRHCVADQALRIQPAPPDTIVNDPDALAVGSKPSAVSKAPIGITGKSPRTIAFWALVRELPLWNEGTFVQWGKEPGGYFGLQYCSRTAGTTLLTQNNLVWDAGFAGAGITTVPEDLTLVWRHFVLSYDGSEAVFHIDGIKQTGSFAVEQLASVDTLATTLRLGNGVDGSLDDVRIYTRILSTDEVQQLFYAEAFTETQREFMTSTPSVMGHYSQAEYNANRTNGQTDVTTNPSAFNLFTQSQYDSHHSNGVTQGVGIVLSNAASYGLYTQAQYDANRSDGILWAFDSLPAVDFAAPSAAEVRAGLGVTNTNITTVAVESLPDGWEFDESTQEIVGRLAGTETVNAVLWASLTSGESVPVSLNFTPIEPDIASISIPLSKKIKAGKATKLSFAVYNHSSSPQPVTIEFTSSDEDLLPAPGARSVTVPGRNSSSGKPGRATGVVELTAGDSAGEVQITASGGGVSSAPCAVTIKAGKKR